MRVVAKQTLPTVRLDGEVAAYIFDGGQHGGLGSSAFIVDVGPGLGPRRHSHPYDEIFVVVAGTVRVEAGGETTEATPDEIVVVPAGVPHVFTNVGPDRARLVNIHTATTVVTEFPDDGPPDDQAVSYEYRHTS
jgi:mannose-6-phosphate isomerase-like protein (cupin superfamily)